MGLEWCKCEIFLLSMCRFCDCVFWILTFNQFHSNAMRCDAVRCNGWANEWVWILNIHSCRISIRCSYMYILFQLVLDKILCKMCMFSLTHSVSISNATQKKRQYQAYLNFYANQKFRHFHTKSDIFIWKWSQRNTVKQTMGNRKNLNRTTPTHLIHCKFQNEMYE